jgi:hypothetical protein
LRYWIIVAYEDTARREYWRFDPSGGEYHDAALAGDLLVDGMYRPIAIEMLDDGRLRGYSDALGLYVCWEDGMLRFFDPGTESYLRSHDEDMARAEEERIARLAAQARANTAETRAEEERTGREAAESRLAEIELELRRLRSE